MRYDSFLYARPGEAEDGPFETGLVLQPRPYEPTGEDDELRLDRTPAEAPRPPRRRRSRVPLILGGWAAVLALALGVAYVTQPGQRLAAADPDQPPAVAPPPTADDLGDPVTAASIASQPDRFAQADSAPEVSAPEADAPAAGQELQIAEAAAPAAPPTPPVAKAEASAPPAADEAPAPAVEKAAPAHMPAKASETTKAERAMTLAEARPKSKAGKPEKIARASGEPKAEPADRKAADAKDLPQLKARIGRAYELAVKAGTPKSVLKARQAEWAQLRAKAEKKGPAAVAALYRTRAAQLEALAKKTSAKNRGKAA